MWIAFILTQKPISINAAGFERLSTLCVTFWMSTSLMCHVDGQCFSLFSHCAPFWLYGAFETFIFCYHETLKEEKRSKIIFSNWNHLKNYRIWRFFFTNSNLPYSRLWVFFLQMRNSCMHHPKLWKANLRKTSLRRPEHQPRVHEVPCQFNDEHYRQNIQRICTNTETTK